jgi:hypothetical protein
VVRARGDNILAHELNRIIGEASIYEVQRFTEVRLSPETLRLLVQALPGNRLNRLLLEDAYPEEIVRSFKGVGTDRWRLDSYTHELAAGQNQLYAEYGDERFSHFRKTFGYANAPLDGLWLRAPYLHNGSVPTLRDLLEPVASRPAAFYRGYDVYDAARVGWEGSVAQEPADSAAANPHLIGRRYFLFETQPKTGKETGAFAEVTAIDPATRLVTLDQPLLRATHLTKIADATGRVLVWDIPVEHSVAGERKLILERLPPDLVPGLCLDYSTPRERNEGNSNSGHEYGVELSAEDKDALVEYMKTF